MKQWIFFQNVTVYGDVHLILRSNSVLNAKCGITVNTPANFTICADSTDEKIGILNATGAAMSYGADSNMSGIGGYYNGSISSQNGYGLVTIAEPVYSDSYGQYWICDVNNSDKGFWLTSPTDLGENIGIKIIGGDGSEQNPFVLAVASDNSHIVSFFAEDSGTLLYTQSVANGGALGNGELDYHSLYFTYKDECWKFLGWYTENDVKYDFSKPVTADISLHEKWAEKTVDIQFIDVNGNAKTTLEIHAVNNSFENTSSQIIIPSAPYLDGYNFTGWTLNETSYRPDEQANLMAALENLVSEIPDDVIIVNEVYEQKHDIFTVTVNNGKIKDGEATGTFNPSAQVYVTATGGAPDQIFSHWEKDGVTVGYEETYAFRMPSFNTTLTAVYKTIPEEKVGTAYIESVNRIADNKLSFVSVVCVPDGCQMMKAGVVVQSTKTLNGAELTTDNARLTKYSDTSNNHYSSFKYTWTMTTNNYTKEWTVRSYLEYTDKKGDIQTIYGEAVSKCVNDVNYDNA